LHEHYVTISLKCIAKVMVIMSPIGCRGCTNVFKFYWPRSKYNPDYSESRVTPMTEEHIADVKTTKPQNTCNIGFYIAATDLTLSHLLTLGPI
jgi:hypothetical protein